MDKLLPIFLSMLGMCFEFGRTSWRKMVPPLVMAVCLTGVYASIHVQKEGSIRAGLRSAFLENETDRTERRRISQQALMQAELRQFSAGNKLIDQLLQTMLERAAGSSRARLNVIHNGVTGLTGTGLLRYDVTNIASAPGRLAGPTVVNQPLSEWSDFLPSLIAGECSYHRVGDLRALALRARFEALGAASLLACPAGDVQGKTVGAVFVLWDGNDPVPAAADMRALMAAEQHLGAQIAAVLDLQGPPPWPSGASNGE